MICPKCGFEQDERLDCKECGIVFSKFNALFSSSEAADSAAEEADMKAGFHQLQLQVRELSSRMIEAEFEKAERKKLRSDLKVLGEQLQRVQAETETRIQRIKAESETRLQQIQAETETRIQQIQAELQSGMYRFKAESDVRMQRIEDGLEKIARESEAGISPEILENLPLPEKITRETSRLTNELDATVDQLTTLWEKTGQNSFQVTELRNQMTSLRNEVLDLKKAIGTFENRKAEEEPQTILEDDLRSIRKNLDELGQFISGLGKKRETVDIH